MMKMGEFEEPLVSGMDEGKKFAQTFAFGRK